MIASKAHGIKAQWMVNGHRSALEEQWSRIGEGAVIKPWKYTISEFTAFLNIVCTCSLSTSPLSCELVPIP